MSKRAAILALIFLFACGEQRAAPRAESKAPKPSGYEPAATNGFGRVGELIYLEEVVGEAAPYAALPMLVLIHGRGDRPQRGWLPLRLPVAVRVIMPQAPLPFGDGFSWSAARASQAEGPSGEALARDLSARAATIVQAIGVLRRERPTRGVPLVAGFSQGGMLSYALAVLHPQAFALAIPISGLLPRALWPATRPAGALPKLRAMHGTIDRVVPIDPARAAVGHLANIGYDAQLTEQPGIAHSITPAMTAQLNTWLSEAVR